MHSEQALLTFNFDYLSSNRMIYGFEFGVSNLVNDEQNYTGTISQYAYSDDVDGIIYSQVVFAGRVGYQLSSQLFLMGTFSC
tara:strand:- start:3784 stop:4029 length:246 start_codon:yes stop_codon:yes gene_type:complete